MFIQSNRATSVYWPIDFYYCRSLEHPPFKMASVSIGVSTSLITLLRGFCTVYDLKVVLCCSAIDDVYAVDDCFAVYMCCYKRVLSRFSQNMSACHLHTLSSH